MNKNYLTFLLDNNICAVEISNVLEVLNYGNLTPIPCAQNYIEGLIYSREQGISVINLRKKFGLKNKNPDKMTKIIVIEILKTSEDGEKTTLYGLVADQVLDVVSLDETVEGKAGSKCSIPHDNIQTVLKSEDKNIILLNFTDL